jgi:hypothetical protein
MVVGNDFLSAWLAKSKLFVRWGHFNLLSLLSELYWLLVGVNLLLCATDILQQTECLVLFLILHGAPRQIARLKLVPALPHDVHL